MTQIQSKNNHRFLLVVLINVFVIFGASAQKSYKNFAENKYVNENDTSKIKGHVKITEYDNIKTLHEKLVDCRKNNSINGWRVLIYMKKGYEGAQEMKLNFETKYPHLKAYIEYQYPQFKVLAGDFRRDQKSEALKLMKELKGKMSNTCWIVPCEIEMPEVVLEDENTGE